MTPRDNYLDLAVRLHVREWNLDTADDRLPPFLLVHGLASNARTWDLVARRLAARGHPVIAVDQRGHGLSEKPPLSAGYDFATVTADLRQLIQSLGWRRPVIAGQSWGGNVLLEFGARYPGVAAGLVFVDGGFFDLGKRSSDWQQIKREMSPPNLAGTPRETLKSWIQQQHPNWSAEGIEAQLANFAVAEDGSVRAHLTLERHLAILRAMWQQRPAELYPLLQDEILICVAGRRSSDSDGMVAAAAEGIKCVTVVNFVDAVHDIHIDQPERLVEVVSDWIASWGDCL